MSLRRLFDTVPVAGLLKQFDTASTLRLLKLVRFIKIVKLGEIFKLRKLIYKVRECH